jgi:hypothetical protein
MKMFMFASILGMLLLASLAEAQQPGGKVGLAAGLKARYAESKLNLMTQADRMPEDAYGFRPTPDIRTFGQVIAHAADTQLFVCAGLKGVPNPVAGKNLERDLTTKAEFVKALADSFALCDDVFASTTDDNSVQFVLQGGTEMARASVLSFLLEHNAEMYGVGTVYLRLKNLVPPSTERENARRRSR